MKSRDNQFPFSQHNEEIWHDSCGESDTKVGPCVHCYRAGWPMKPDRNAASSNRLEGFLPNSLVACRQFSPMKVGECKRQQFPVRIFQSTQDSAGRGRRGREDGTKVLAGKPTANPLSKFSSSTSSHQHEAVAAVPHLDSSSQPGSR